ncbi:hypothetical protein OG563_05895 [Nocardia vinacea]|uniref:Uncharacterized protein n=1 Tax=Nocardia vinacea TaxID=96468 RepID=A0ABZ1YXL8_9NOCA|nr:hypothetical protein [Nocardia vinacea]
MGDTWVIDSGMYFDSNGDATKLGIAADAWKTFADNTNVTGAADRIKGGRNCRHRRASMRC